MISLFGPVMTSVKNKCGVPQFNLNHRINSVLFMLMDASKVQVHNYTSINLLISIQFMAICLHLAQLTLTTKVVGAIAIGGTESINMGESATVMLGVL